MCLVSRHKKTNTKKQRNAPLHAAGADDALVAGAVAVAHAAAEHDRARLEAAVRVVWEARRRVLGRQLELVCFLFFLAGCVFGARGVELRAAGVMTARAPRECQRHTHLCARNNC